MNLKEAFRFQNRLQSLTDEVVEFLSDTDNVLHTEMTYLRKKVMPEAENETIEARQPGEYSDKVNEMMAFLLWLLEQKELLSAAIARAKAAQELDMDSQVALNSQRQRLARVFAELADLRPRETTVSGGGVGYRFNAEGNQVTYRCDLRQVTTINFDRNKARKYLAALNRQADETSAAIDRCLINSRVEYDVPFDVNDSLAQVFEAFLGG